VEDCPDAVVYADVAGKIRFWNHSATRIFGYEAVEALGQTLDLIVPESLRARHWQGYDRVMAGGESRYGEGDVLAVPAIRKDGRRISIEFTVLPMRDDAGANARNRRFPTRHDSAVRGAARVASGERGAQGADWARVTRGWPGSAGLW
jgi:PAS domain S-box-containing protein